MISAERAAELVEIVKAKGPHRVMVDQFEATPGGRAKERGIGYDVIFVRADGWTLGASHALEADARRTWADEWIGKLDVATGVYTAIGRAS